MAKSGGTSMNSYLANNYERVCGNKGNSYEAYKENEQWKQNKAIYDIKHANGTYDEKKLIWNHLWYDGPENYNRDNKGNEDCDIVFQEVQYKWWMNQFPNGKFHQNTTVELHVPCREPIDSLISQCNYWDNLGWGTQIPCDDTITDEQLYEAVEECYAGVANRYRHELKNHFSPNNVKCFDFKNLFTSYKDYITPKLQPRRFVSQPYAPKLSNYPRNKSQECIWQYPGLQEKVRSYLLQTVPYYEFCNECIGSENEIK